MIALDQEDLWKRKSKRIIIGGQLPILTWFYIEYIIEFLDLINPCKFHNNPLIIIFLIENNMLFYI
jgi:hypothetical protein